MLRDALCLHRIGGTLLDIVQERSPTEDEPMEDLESSPTSNAARVI